MAPSMVSTAMNPSNCRARENRFVGTPGRVKGSLLPHIAVARVTRGTRTPPRTPARSDKRKRVGLCREPAK